MKQSKQSVERTKKALFELAQNSAYDPITQRIAYTVADALMWASEDTVGWKRPEQKIHNAANLLKQGK
jgi:hypothetical protein